MLVKDGTDVGRKRGRAARHVCNDSGGAPFGNTPVYQ